MKLLDNFFLEISFLKYFDLPTGRALANFDAAACCYLKSTSEIPVAVASRRHIKGRVRCQGFALTLNMSRSTVRILPATSVTQRRKLTFATQNKLAAGRQSNDVRLRASLYPRLARLAANLLSRSLFLEFFQLH